MNYSADAYHRFMAADDADQRHHLFLSMVVAYCRPFTENHGIGSLKCEYPTFPDFADEEMNERHRKMLDLRNRFLGHSSIEGIRVWLLAPGALHPVIGVPVGDYSYAIQKREFSHPQFAPWLHDVVRTLGIRLASDVALVSKEIGSNYLKEREFYILESGKPFEWTK